MFNVTVRGATPTSIRCPKCNDELEIPPAEDTEKRVIIQTVVCTNCGESTNVRVIK